LANDEKESNKISKDERKSNYSKIRLIRNVPMLDKQHNKETLALGENIRATRQIEIQKDEYGINGYQHGDMDFLIFFTDLMKSKFNSSGNYGNWKAAKNHLEKYRPNGILMKDINMDFLEGFQVHLLSNNKIKQNSKVSYYRKLVAAIKKAHNKKYILENPTKLVKGLKEEETKREYLTLEELRKVAKLDCDIPAYKTAFLFSALTGLRFSDVEKLRKKDILGSKKKGYYIRHKEKKTGSQEALTLSLSAINLIDLAGPKEAPIIPDLEYSSHNNIKLQEWINKAKIDKKITLHCARHTFATLQLTLGTDLYTVSKLLGHKEIKTTQIYAKIIDKKKQEATDKLNEISL